MNPSLSNPDDVTNGGNIPISCFTEVVEVKVQVVHNDVTEVSQTDETSTITMCCIGSTFGVPIPADSTKMTASKKLRRDDLGFPTLWLEKVAS